MLYWIPFLHAFMHRYKIDPSRLIAIGRGGSAAWYGFNGSADLYEFVPVETVRTWSLQASQQTGSLKQHTVEPWEAHVCGLTAASLGLERYHTLSAQWMYRLLGPWWRGTASQRWLDQRTAQPVRVKAAKADVTLPERFIAMRWYARPTWPLNDGLTLWMRTFTERVSKQLPVILLDSFHADDHADINLGEIPNVTRLSQIAQLTPLNNLAVQSAVISKAEAYIGTYGGLSQAAMRWGVPTLALYQEFGQTAPEHLALTQNLSLRTGVPFIACRPKDVDGALPMLVGRA